VDEATLKKLLRLDEPVVKEVVTTQVPQIQKVPEKKEQAKPVVEKTEERKQPARPTEQVKPAIVEQKPQA